MKRIIALLIILFILPNLSGCLTSAILEERESSVVKASKFDSDCTSMKLVSKMENERYKLEGCGYTYIYVCHDRFTLTGDSDLDLLNLTLTGGVDPEAPCFLVRAYVSGGDHEG